MTCFNFSFSKLNRLQETRPWVYSECGIHEYISSGLVWDEWISAQASSQSNRYQFSSVCSVGLELVRPARANYCRIIAGIAEFGDIHRAQRICVLHNCAPGCWGQLEALQLQTPQCWLEAPARCGDNPLTITKKSCLCVSIPHALHLLVWAVLATCLTLILILNVHLCKVKLMPQQNRVDCVRIWSQNKGDWYSQWARWWWSLMTKCWRVNPTFLTTLVGRTRQCFLSTG